VHFIPPIGNNLGDRRYLLAAGHRHDRSVDRPRRSRTQRRLGVQVDRDRDLHRER
jgi:hypothetical protein